MTEKTCEPALPRIVGDRQLPDGWDAWAMKSVRPDLTTRNNYRYPWPGHIAEAAGPFLDHNDPCPEREGDGICLAFTYNGMRSGGQPARTLLLMAYRHDDVLGSDSDKLRVRRALVVDVLDGERLTRGNLHGADLTGAYLRGADLGGWERGPGGYARRTGGVS